jgi:hypothetical protein
VGACRSCGQSYKCCLGSYNCPEQGCRFKSRPRLPQNPTKQSAKIFLPPKNPYCWIHDTTDVINSSCLAESRVYTSTKVDDRHVKVKHIGFRSHPKPPPIRPTVDDPKEFRNLVKTYPTIKPIALSTGSKHRKAPHEIHPCYANNDKMRSKRKKI